MLRLRLHSLISEVYSNLHDEAFDQMFATRNKIQRLPPITKGKPSCSEPLGGAAFPRQFNQVQVLLMCQHLAGELLTILCSSVWNTVEKGIATEKTNPKVSFPCIHDYN